MSPCVLDLGMLTTTHVDRQQTDPASPAKPPCTAQEFYKSHAMFVAVLEQLQQQLAGLAKEDAPAAPPAVLQRVAAKVGDRATSRPASSATAWQFAFGAGALGRIHAHAHLRSPPVSPPTPPAQAPTPGLEAYFAQRHPQPPPPANLAEQIDVNLRVLQVLAAEMRGFDALLQGLLGVRPAPRCRQAGPHAGSRPRRVRRRAESVWSGGCHSSLSCRDVQDVGRPGAAGQDPAERGSADHGPPGQGLAHPGVAEQGQSDAQPEPAQQLSDQGAAAQGCAIFANSQLLLWAAAAEGIQKEMTLIVSLPFLSGVVGLRGALTPAPSRRMQVTASRSGTCYELQCSTARRRSAWRQQYHWTCCLTSWPPTQSC